MPDAANPYNPGQPVERAELFFGRRELFSSLREQLVRGRRVFLVSGARRTGRTSLLRRLPEHLPEGYVPVTLGLREQEALRLDWLLWRLADAIGIQVSLRLGISLPEPVWDDFQAKPGQFLDQFWPQVASVLGYRCLVLMLDDLDVLAAPSGELLDAFAAVLTEWHESDSGVALVLASSAELQARLVRDQPRLCAGAQTHPLGPLTSDEAARLISWPVEGILTYDYGVPRRLIEVTSGQPYYLHLVCHELFNRCAGSGWVNQHDLDVVLTELVSREIADFREQWEASTPVEQAVLASLASMRGARGVATIQDLSTMLARARSRVKEEHVADALGTLCARGVVERLGALSYRLRVALLGDWLAHRVRLQEVMRTTRLPAVQHKGREAKPPAPVPAKRAKRIPGRRPGGARGRAAEPEEAGTASPQVPGPSGAEGPTGKTCRRRWRWIALTAALGLAALAGIAAWFLWLGAPAPAPTATRQVLAASASPTATLPAPPADRTVVAAAVTPTRTAAPKRTATPSPSVVPSPTKRPSATPTATPTSVIVSRPAFAIAYQSRSTGEEGWSITLMTADGRERTRLTAGQSGFLTAPSWSPDGSQIAYVSDALGVADIWVTSTGGSGTPVNLTRDEAKDHSPSWSPDGEWIAFASVRDSPYWELYVMRADGTGVRRVTWWEDASDLSPSWSPDGRRLAFASKRDGNWEIYLVDRDGSNLRRLTENPADDTNPVWSPDGSRIAFESTRDGYTDIYLLPADGGEAVNVCNTSWATDLGPSWSPDGSRLAFYSDRDGNWDVFVMSADGSNVQKLTGAGTNDQVPSWRP